MQNSRLAVLGVGSNLGGRVSLLRAARWALIDHPEVHHVRVSSVRETRPMGPAQPPYLNAAIALETTLSPDELMTLALSVEALLGRVRDVRWGPRTLDLDVLWIRDEAHHSPRITVPHPGLLERRFALAPLVELVPDAVDPRDGRSLAEHLAALPDDGLGRDFVLTETAEGVEVEHTADEGFELFAPTRADLLAGAAEMLAGLVVVPDGVRIVRPIALAVAVDPEAGDDERLFAWLSEVLYTVDARRFAVRAAAVTHDGETEVRGVLLGEDIDEARHHVRGALKAVTFHGMEIAPQGDGRWFARVVVDV